MANRILNDDPADAADWLDLLRGAQTHPAASATTKSDATDFLEYQATPH